MGADTRSRTDLTVVAGTDPASQEAYLEIQLPTLAASIPHGSVAYAEVTFPTGLREGVDLECWRPSGDGTLPWAGDAEPMLRTTTLEDGRIRLDVTQIVRRWPSRAEGKLILRLAPGQENPGSDLTAVLAPRLTYHEIGRE